MTPTSRPLPNLIARLVLLITMAATPVVHAGESFRLTALDRLARTGNAISAMVVNLSTGETIATLDAGQRLLPASVTKLYTAAAALRHWGADYTFTTRLLTTGTLHGDTIDGDLILLGSGDPAFDHDDLARLASLLGSRGITQVTGRLIVNTSLFGAIQCVTRDRCEARDASRHSYDAPLSAAGVDFSNVTVDVLPSLKPGAPAAVALHPVTMPMFRLEAHVATVAPDAPAAVAMTRHDSGNHDILIVSGKVPAGGAPVHRYRSVSDPNRFTGQMLRGLLRRAGIEVTGSDAVDARPPAAGAKTVAEVNGLPLAEQVRRMLLYSNNYMADMFALDLLRDTSPDQPAELHAAGSLLSRFAATTDTDSRFGGHHQTPPLLQSGSGLTVGNRLAADDLVALLDSMYHDAANFPAFLGALTVPGQTPVKTLKEAGDTAWLTRIAAKTGSLSEPVGVFSLAGYFRFDNGEWGAFAVVVNSQQPSHTLRGQALRAIRDDLERLLASH